MSGTPYGTAISSTGVYRPESSEQAAPSPVQGGWGWNGGQQTTTETRSYTQMPAAERSPYEKAYWDTQMAREQERTGYGQRAAAMLEPQAFATAGLPKSYWDAQTKKGLDAANMEYLSEVAQANKLRGPARDYVLNRARRNYARASARVASDVRMKAAETGLEMALKRAQGYTGLAQVAKPDISEPKMLPLETLLTGATKTAPGEYRGATGQIMHGGGGGDKEFANDEVRRARDAFGVTNSKGLTKENVEYLRDTSLTDRGAQMWESYWMRNWGPTLTTQKPGGGGGNAAASSTYPAGTGLG